MKYKRPLLKVIVIVLIVFTALIFLASAVMTTSDAQGGFVFILSLPLCALLCGLAFYFSRGLDSLRKVVSGVMMALSLFTVSLFIPLYALFLLQSSLV